MMNGAFELVLQKLKCSRSCKHNYQVFADVLKSCAAISGTSLGKTLHGQVIRQGHNSCQFVLKALLNMYAKCKALEDCQKLFGEINSRDIVTWNILLSGFAGTLKDDNKAMQLFRRLHFACDPKPTSVTLAIVVPVYTRSGALSAGKCIHSYAIKSGMESLTLVGNAIVSMYAKCGLVLDASSVFHGIADKDVVSWNAVIAGFAENKLVDDAFQLFQWMIKGQIVPNYATVANILSICSGLGEIVGYRYAKEIHCYVLRHAELGDEVTVVNALLSCYLRLGQIREAESLFWRMKLWDLVSWNSIIAGYVSNGEWLKALQMFQEFLVVEKIEPDSVTLLSILPACALLSNLHVGKQIHGFVVRRRALFEDTSVGNALISIYAKSGCIEAAFSTFLLIPRRDVISWNTLLDALCENVLDTEFFEVLNWMLREGIKPDSVTILAVVRYLSSLSIVDKIREAHGFSLRSGLLLSGAEPTLANALLDAYAKCGNMVFASKLFESLSRNRNVITCNSMISGYAANGLQDDANLLFQSMPERDLTTWNLMLQVYAQNQFPDEALNLFQELQFHELKPDAMTIMSILPVCTQKASLHMLRQCHGYVVRAYFEDVHLKAALLDVYSKCGNINSAYKFYKSMPERDLVVSTAMVGGYAMHGMGEEALGVFYHMLEFGVKPDHVIITAVLSACSHAGLINEGLMIFDSIEQVYHMKPSMEQYACTVDLLARGGQVKEAFTFVNQMPVAANANIWGTLLGACKTYHEVDIGRVVADHLSKMETSDIGNYIVLSNLYAADARWDGVLETRRLMKMKNLKKPAGCSWIEVGRRKNVFVAGDYFHPNINMIYSMLSDLDKQIKELYKSR
ncbi:putative pentatricopeptide repeat-containing protein At5g08490 [Olea europaea var. sylvestris]|nr:putative pentatricopeptide repeat-containing protein At5g08490 [Olea europaea var. sylvestris]XP_022897016.1 putative pentatricopeptide repeat-containing protein At5g08490 [Olea europaea var. sylvestris]XP_022897017.1 putative pentatricopeptide repeat-containing protein At5g08490 [Olea europaea var. sylvestris]